MMTGRSRLTHEPPKAGTSGRAWEMTLLATDNAPGLARRATRDILASWHVADLEETAVLFVSELVTNTVRHARAGGCTLALRLEAAGTVLRIEVHDADPSRPQLRRPAELDGSGFGFVIVDALSSGWGVSETASGKAVWAELAVRPRPPARLARRAPAAGQDHGQRPHRLRPGQNPLGQADLPASADQLRTEPHEQAEQYPRRGSAQHLGCRPGGGAGPRRRAASGHTDRAMKPTAAQTVCGTEPPPPAGSGFAATSTVAAPPVIRMSRPAGEAGLSASPVRT